MEFIVVIREKPAFIILNVRQLCKSWNPTVATLFFVYILFMKFEEKIRLIGLLTTVLLLLINFVFAQDNLDAGETVSLSLPEMAVIDIEGDAPALALSAPTEAGERLPDITSSGHWLNYTSIVGSETTHKITASISSGIVPAGTMLRIWINSYSGNGNGEMGVSFSESTGTQLTLSNTNQDIVNSIGSCYTDNGINNGRNIFYRWRIPPLVYSDVISASGSDIIVTYTIIAE